jgi:hypothetical protein
MKPRTLLRFGPHALTSIVSHKLTLCVQLEVIERKGIKLYDVLYYFNEMLICCYSSLF